MIQFIVSGDTASILIDACRAALENACKWIRLDLSHLRENEVEPTVESIKESCKSFDAILSVDNDVDAVKRLKVDGLHIGNTESASAAQARKQLGEEIILGVTIDDASAVPFLPRTAVDYVEIDENVGATGVRNEIVKQMKALGFDEPVVARLKGIPTLQEVRAWGVDGISLDSSTVNPAELKDLILRLESLAQERINDL